jgi:hypothetical protein
MLKVGCRPVLLRSARYMGEWGATVSDLADTGSVTGRVLQMP